MSLDQYLAQQGVSSPISDYMLDKLRIPHGLTYRKQKELIQGNQKAADDYAKKRNRCIQEYRTMVELGKIMPLSRAEQLIKTANGHPDKQSTQAARRVCDKRGIDWRTEDGLD